MEHEKETLVLFYICGGIRANRDAHLRKRSELQFDWVVHVKGGITGHPRVEKKIKSIRGFEKKEEPGRIRERGGLSDDIKAYREIEGGIISVDDRCLVLF